jgi:AcrR family transcriptional regulator
MAKGTTIDDERAPDAAPERRLAAEATLGLRERKKAMTRLALEDAALDLFTKKGFDHTTVDEIAEACNVSRRTFFRYFASKEDIFSGDKDVHDGEMFDLIAARPADEPALESLRATLIALAADLEADRSRMVAKVCIINETPSLRSAGLEHEQGTIDLVVEALARRSEVPVDDEDRFRLRLVTQAAIGALRAAIDRWVAGGAQEDLGDVAVEALDALADGFGRPSRSSGR